MNNIERLIKEECPDGVKYLPLWTITNWDKRFNNVNKEKQKELAGPFKHILAAKMKSLATKDNNGEVKLLSTGNFEGRTSKALCANVLNEAEVIAIPSGGTANIKYCNGYFVDSGNILATTSDENLYNLKYIFYNLLSKQDLIQSLYRGSGIKHPDMASILDIKIPVPSIKIQQKIVMMLDSFTELKSELKSELNKRGQQYAYYRNHLLYSDSKTPKVELREIVKRKSSGATPNKGNKSYYEGANIPWIRTQDVVFNEINKANSFITEKAVKETAAKWIPKNCVIVAISGASAGRCAINKIEATTNQHCLNLEINDDLALYKYVFYCVSSSYETLISKKQGARGDLNSNLILSITIPLPSIKVQKTIVESLEKFDFLYDALRLEIEARHKQYEYYRDKLLTFDEGVVNE